jgi:arginine deiminase
MRIQVDSEIGRLRRVLLHRPGREIDRMPPSMMEQLLFDDILYGDEAREEHDRFTQVLRQAGVEVLDGEVLLAEVLREEVPRSRLLAELANDYGVAPGLAARLAELPADRLAAALIEGVPAGPDAVEAGGRKFFDLAPLPNYFFQRDSQLVLGDRVVCPSMATAAREREPLLSRTLFNYHPALQGYADLFDIDVPPAGGPQHDPLYPYPSLEGGDVLVASKEIVLMGMSERTDRRGVEVLAEYLRREETSFRHLILVEMPPKRSYMHLDTVFTLIDRNTCLAYQPVIEPGGREAAFVYHVDLYARELSFAVRPSLLSALATLGMELEVVPCGGAADSIDQQREQWTDGANAFALAPGVLILYSRNRKTIEELGRRGFRVLTEEEAATGEHDLLGGSRTVVTLAANELSRARGGPRCMTMPIERDSL